jgi:hypothetical protein
LGDHPALFGAERFAVGPGRHYRAGEFGRPFVRGLDFFNIATSQNPAVAQRRKTAFDITLKAGITPGAGTIVYAHGVVRLAGSFEGFGWLKADLPERDLDVGMDGSRKINAVGIGQREGALGFE